MTDEEVDELLKGVQIGSYVGKLSRRPALTFFAATAMSTMNLLSALSLVNRSNLGYYAGTFTLENRKMIVLTVISIRTRLLERICPRGISTA